jgi:hypothetical protein
LSLGLVPALILSASKAYAVAAPSVKHARSARRR